MPSVTRSVVSEDFASSTWITPSLPTFSIALAISSPMSDSLLAEMEATFAQSSLVFTGLASEETSFTSAAVAASMPRFRSIGDPPAMTYLRPSLTMACASTVAVVVPSPATSAVFEATSFTSCAPMFSNASSSSISLATDTPSLVEAGEPKLFASTTLRPLGPMVILTALASLSTPRLSAARAAASKTSCFAIVCSPVEGDSCSPIWWGRIPFAHFQILKPLDDREDIALAHDQVILAIDLNLGAGILPVQNRVTGLDFHFDQRARVRGLARTDGDDLALLRLFLGVIGDVQSARGLFRSLKRLNDDTV